MWPVGIVKQLWSGSIQTNLLVTKANHRVQLVLQFVLHLEKVLESEVLHTALTISIVICASKTACVSFHEAICWTAKLCDHNGYKWNLLPLPTLPRIESNPPPVVMYSFSSNSVILPLDSTAQVYSSSVAMCVLYVWEGDLSGFVKSQALTTYCIVSIRIEFVFLRLQYKRPSSVICVYVQKCVALLSVLYVSISKISEIAVQAVRLQWANLLPHANNTQG